MSYMGNNSLGGEALQEGFPYHTLHPYTISGHVPNKARTVPAGAAGFGGVNRHKYYYNSLRHAAGNAAGAVSALGRSGSAGATTLAGTKNSAAARALLALLRRHKVVSDGDADLMRCDLLLLLEYLHLRYLGLPVTTHHELVTSCRGVIHGLQRLGLREHETMVGKGLQRQWHDWLSHFTWMHDCYARSQRQGQQQQQDGSKESPYVPDAATCSRAAWDVARYILPEYADWVSRDTAGQPVADVDPALPALRLNKGTPKRKWCVLDELQLVHIPEAVGWVKKHIKHMPLLVGV
jgi:hypothetical protein